MGTNLAASQYLEVIYSWPSIQTALLWWAWVRRVMNDDVRVWGPWDGQRERRTGSWTVPRPPRAAFAPTRAPAVTSRWLRPPPTRPESSGRPERRHRHSCVISQRILPRAGYGVEKIDPLRFLAGRHKRRLNQALYVLFLSLFFEYVCCAVN